MTPTTAPRRNVIATAGATYAGLLVLLVGLRGYGASLSEHYRNSPKVLSSVTLLLISLTDTSVWTWSCTVLASIVFGVVYRRAGARRRDIATAGAAVVLVCFAVLRWSHGYELARVGSLLVHGFSDNHMPMGVLIADALLLGWPAWAPLVLIAVLQRRD